MKLKKENWKVQAEVEKFLNTKYFIKIFPFSIGTFQLEWKLSYFKLSNLKLAKFSFFKSPFPISGIPNIHVSK